MDIFCHFKVDMAFTFNNIDLQLTLIFEQALMEYEHVSELWKVIHLTLIFIQ